MYGLLFITLAFSLTFADSIHVRDRCGENDFRCKSQKCVPNNQVCDRVFDCPDGGDELNCTCTSDDYRCTSGMCLQKYRVCDGRYDCEDNSDELNCTCTSDDYRCDNGQCVSNHKVCDGINDCLTGDDESNCDKCYGPKYFRCKSGKCVANNQVCDRVYDCPDGDDELSCICTSEEYRCLSSRCVDKNRVCDGLFDCEDREDEFDCNCKSEEFRCDTGRCVSNHKVCDGVIDCFSGDDESNCYICNGPNAFRCTNGKCVAKNQVCDRVDDCPNGEDELNCNCTSEEYRCNIDGQCVSNDKLCDGKSDCMDGEDELNCDNCDAPNVFRCTSGMCLPKYRVCDGRYDCEDNSDELNCTCTSNEYRCNIYGQCVSKDKLCDGKSDCMDGEDELNCDNCDGPNEFRCTSGMCLPKYRVCDGRYDCEDNSDELNCTCTSDDYRCNIDGQCVSKDKLCDGKSDCMDGDDELNCDKCDGPNEFRCTSGMCLPKYRVCDGRYDCEDNSDELNCTCTSDEYRCNIDGQCVSNDKLCDGKSDCVAGDDELNCDKCDGPNDFRCVMSKECLMTYQICNGVPECSDSSDEINCNIPETASPAPDDADTRVQTQESDLMQKVFRKGYIYQPAVKGWLKLHRSPTTWVQARLQCQAEGSILASPLNKDLQDAMTATMADRAHSIYTGISSTISGKEYFSIEGVSLDDIPTGWTNEKPTHEVPQQCVVMRRENSKSFLADVSCEELQPYICYKRNSTDIPKVNRCGTPDPEYVFEEETGHCYKFHYTSATWTSAYRECASEGGYLAIVNSDKEAQLLQNIVFKYRRNTDFINDPNSTINVGFYDWRDQKGDNRPYWEHHRLWMTIHGETLKEAGYARISSASFDKNNKKDANCGAFSPATKLLHYTECYYTDSIICEMDPIN